MGGTREGDVGEERKGAEMEGRGGEKDVMWPKKKVREAAEQEGEEGATLDRDKEAEQRWRTIEITRLLQAVNWEHWEAVM